MPVNQLSAYEEGDLAAADERWLAIEQLVESPYFKKSPRLRSLLLYLGTQTLAARSDLLTEHHIAHTVFQRKADFDPEVDTIVRSHMVRLRQKLDQYAIENEANSSICVTVPKGEYRVRFDHTRSRLPQAALSGMEPPPRTSPKPTASQPRTPLLLACGLLSLLVLLLLTALTVMFLRSRDTSREGLAAGAVAKHPLWSHFFQPHQTTTLIAADSGLVLLHRMTGKGTTLQEYLTRNFSQETRGLSAERTDEVLNMGERRYTSFVDLDLYRRLEQVAAASPGKLDVRYARDMQMDELKQGNLLLSGSRGANPWLALYEPRMNFIGTDEWVSHGYTFLNRHPLAGEAAAYSTSEGDRTQRVLGVLAYLPNLEGAGRTLIVEGNSMAGTEAISDFLFDDAALLPFLKKLSQPDGTVPYFEVLIEANSVNGSAGPFRILAYRTH
jgi:hypothetical protein